MIKTVKLEAEAEHRFNLRTILALVSKISAIV